MALQINSVFPSSLYRIICPYERYYSMYYDHNLHPSLFPEWAYPSGKLLGYQSKVSNSKLYLGISLLNGIFLIQIYMSYNLYWVNDLKTSEQWTQPLELWSNWFLPLSHLPWVFDCMLAAFTLLFCSLNLATPICYVDIFSVQTDKLKFTVISKNAYLPLKNANVRLLLFQVKHHSRHCLDSACWTF